MRIVPAYVARALREFDKDVDLIWSDNDACWFFYYQGQRLFSYEHEDGMFAVDCNVGEILQILKAADGKNKSGLDKLKEAEKRRTVRIESEQREKYRNEEDGAKEAREITSGFFSPKAYSYSGQTRGRR